MAIRECISGIVKCGNASCVRDELVSLMTELDDASSNRETGDLSVSLSDNFHDALRDLNDPLMPTRAHGLICLKRLIMSRDATVLENWKRVLQLLDISLADGDSYIYLSAINTLAALCLTNTDQTLPILLQAYRNEDRTIQERLNVAEVIVRVSRSLGESAPKYSHLIFETFMHSLKDTDEMIRVSSLSNLAHFCARMGSSLKPFMGELLHSVQSLIRNDDSLLVKRAGFMLLHLTLTGIDGHSFEVRFTFPGTQSRPFRMSFIPEQIIQEYGSRLHRLALEAYTSDPDDVSRLHAQLALEEMDRIARDRICCLTKSGACDRIK